MKAGTYEEERAFQAHLTAQEIVSHLNPTISGASSSCPGSVHNYASGSVPETPTRSQISDNYLYIPASAGNYITDEVIPQRRSSARRLFSICCVFDFLLMTILWVIISINTYKDLPTAWDQAIKHFQFKHSMADLLLLSWVRSAILILHYWVIMSKIQITVIFTTITSTVYVFVKLVLFDKGTNNSFETYSLLLASFLLCWTEVWLFETKVLKVETQVTRILRPNYNSETTPLLAPGGIATGSESVFNYSAFQTPSATVPPTPGGAILPPEDLADLDYRGKCLYEVAVDALSQLRETVFWPDGWTTESEKDGVRVFSRAQLKRKNRLFLSESNLFCSLEDLFDVLYSQIGQSTAWNTSILKLEEVERLNSRLDLIYTVGIGGGGGLIKSRDFLTLRYWAKERDMFFIVNRDIDDPIKAESKAYTRGFNGPCGYVFFPDLDGSVKLTYVVNTDLKLSMVPAKVINSNLVEVVHGTHLALRKRIDEYLEVKRRKNTMDG